MVPKYASQQISVRSSLGFPFLSVPESCCSQLGILFLCTHKSGRSHTGWPRVQLFTSMPRSLQVHGDTSSVCPYPISQEFLLHSQVCVWSGYGPRTRAEHWRQRINIFLARVYCLLTVSLRITLVSEVFLKTKEFELSHFDLCLFLSHMLADAERVLHTSEAGSRERARAHISICYPSRSLAPSISSRYAPLPSVSCPSSLPRPNSFQVARTT